MKNINTKVTVTETYVTNLIAKVEMTYVPDHCMGPRTIKVGEIVETYKGGYWAAAPWAYEGHAAENFRIEKLLVTRKITTEVTTEVVG